ncbi:MAG: hypothetical protein A3J69_01395 [Candidatus Levybacteria bacterium RIFCSPHIGHO2_02_FULL_42_12]|nr:MAG: hypothetical protein A3J69_01395 [Candidatus Levybacteria bacterium RIFCSPHIGHO2_02_FULL_42_12]OGH42547.1 MAG: hypothetical protein A3B53_01050 [Candidatus Levybacteria bacterium RIFCSPLOWO2_01_FULL_42_15]
MKHTLDAIVVGDAVIDAFLAIKNTHEFLRLDANTHDLCVRYGAKIPVDDCQFLLGGNGANVAVGLSRLAINASLCAETGDDEFSSKILRGLSENGVDTSLLIKTPHAPSTFSVILNFQKERTIFSRHVLRKHAFSLENIAAKWVYLTSLGEEWKEAYASVVSYVQQTHAKLAFNPGSHQMEAGFPALKEVLAHTSLLFINLEEAQKIAQEAKNFSKSSPEELLVSLQKLGSSIVVITNGEHGSYSIDKSGKVAHIGSYPAEAIERTGAGDAYASGFLAASIKNLDVEEAMRWGNTNAGSVIQFVGAQKGLLTEGEIHG